MKIPSAGISTSWTLVSDTSKVEVQPGSSSPVQDAAEPASPQPASAGLPSVADLRLSHEFRVGDTRLFDATAAWLSLPEGPVSEAHLEQLAEGLAAGAMAKLGFNTVPELFFSAGSAGRPQTGWFRDCAKAERVDPSSLSDSQKASIDARFQASLVAAGRAGFVDLPIAERLMCAAIRDCTKP